MQRERLRRLGLGPGRLLATVVCLTLLAACAPSAAPAPTQAPAKPADPPKAGAEPAKVAESKPAAPAPTTAPAAKPAEAAKPADPPQAGAAAAPAAPAAPRSAEPTVLQLALVPSLNYSPVFIGVEKGFFVKHDLDVKVRFNATGPEASKALEAGDVDIGAANFSTLVAARAGGARLRGFWLFQNDPFVVNDDDTVAVIVPPGSPIQSIKDLAGKKVARSVAGAFDPYIKLHLRAAGVDPDTVELINVAHANIPGALKGGGLDAAVFTEPYAQIYLQDVPGGRVIQRGGGKVAFKVLAVAREDWLEKNRPLAERFSVALAEASQYVRKNQEESALIATRWLPGLQAEASRKAIPFFTFDSRFSKQVAASWEQESKTLVEQKRTKEPIPLADGFDTSLAESVPGKYPQFFADLKPLP